MIREVVERTFPPNDDRPPNGKLLEPAGIVSWGGFSMTLACLYGIAASLLWDDRWDYFINLSTADFPILTQVRGWTATVPCRPVSSLVVPCRVVFTADAVLLSPCQRGRRCSICLHDTHEIKAGVPAAPRSSRAIFSCSKNVHSKQAVPPPTPVFFFTRSVTRKTETTNYSSAFVVG